jgi:uncharacterized protein YfaS (alpha-2-macroglobulin family)
MNRLRVYLVLMLFILLSIGPSGCRKKEMESQGPSSVSETTAGELHVVYATPRGKTTEGHESDTVVAVFDRPLFPLETLESQPDPDLLEIKPDIPGRFRWLNPKTVSFTPDERFPYASDFHVVIPAGVKTFDGFVLSEDFKWTFQTLSPTLVQHSPRNKQQWLRLDSQILLVFNQPVLSQGNKDFITLTGLQRNRQEGPLPFRIKNPTAKQLKEQGIQATPKEVLLIEPNEALKPETTYYLELKSGLRSEEGPLGMEKSRLFEFQTFNIFRFERFETEEGYDVYLPLKFHFSNPVIYREFIQKIHFEPSVVIPDSYEEWDHGASILWLSLPFQPETDYKLCIDGDLEDEFGHTLGTPVVLQFKTLPYPRSVSMDTGHGLIEAYGPLQHPLYSVNAENISIQGGQLSKENVIPLLKKPKIFWTGEKFPPSDLITLNKNIRLDAPRNKRDVFPIDLGDFIRERYGFIFLQLDTLSKNNWERYPKAFLQVTGLGISAKFSPENNCVWVTELRSGEPVPEAEVEIRNDSNRIVWTGKTDAEGKVETPGWSLLKFQSQDRWSKPRQWVFVTKGDDSTFLSSEWGTGVSPYQFDIPYDWEPVPQKFDGYVFTERGIYRAGEEIHIKGVLREREKGDWRIPRIDTLTCEIFDPFEKSVFKEQLGIDPYGSFSFDFESIEDSSLGEYRILTSVSSAGKPEEDFNVHSSFRIEAFRPAEYEVHLRTSQGSFVFGDTYSGEMRASYLFGGPMSGQKASWHLRLNPSYYSPPGHEGYIFGDQVGRWETYRLDTSRLLDAGEATLDETGKIQIVAKLTAEQEMNSVLATLEATVQGPDRRAVTSRIRTLVHRGDYYIGLKPETTFLTKGEELQVAVLSSHPEGMLVSDKKIRLSLFKREWHSVRKAEFGGRYRWISETKDIPIDSRSVQTQMRPEFLTFLPEKSGFYILKAEGNDRKGNTITTSTYFYVTGGDYVPWERHDDDTVELICNKTSYRPGETAKILVKSPYEKTRALITVEREFILDSKIVELEGNAEHIEIPILPDFIPNVYVSVLLVQGRVSAAEFSQTEDLGKPAFKIGYVKIAVDPSEKRLNVRIQTDQEAYRPGQEVKVSLKTEDWTGTGLKSSLAVAVVDVGVLNLIGYQTPDPFSHFYSHKPLSVQTSESRQYVIGQRAYGEKGDDVGGGAGEEEMKSLGAALTEVELRGDFKFTAYWNSHLLTDEAGEAGFSFVLPDNLTTFRIMTVAQTQESHFGRGESTFKVSKTLLLQPSLPRFARLGDSFQGGVVVFNSSQDKGQVTVDCEAQGLQLTGDSRRSLTLDAGEGSEVLYSFTVDAPGTARLVFRAEMGGESDGLEIDLPLQMPRPVETVATSNSTTKSVEEKIRIPENVHPSHSLIQVSASPSALSELKGSVDYLTDYPYLCLEQRLSRLLPYVIGQDLLLDYNLTDKSRKEIREFVLSNIKEIYSYQKSNGGFGLWPGSVQENPYNSCYTAFAFYQARKAGYPIDKTSEERLTDYLKNLVRDKLNAQQFPYTRKSWLTVKAFAHYCLTLLDLPDYSSMETLYSEREYLSLLAKTFLVKTMFVGKASRSALDTLLGELMNSIKISPTDAHFEDDEGREGAWIYSSNLRTTALILQALIEVGEDNPFIPQIAQWLVKKKDADRWPTTQDNFFAFYALNDFYEKFENVRPDFNLRVSLQDKELMDESFSVSKREAKITEMPLDSFFAGDILPLNFRKKGSGILYYQTRLTYSPRQPLLARDEGFSVYKTLTTLEGKPLSHIQAGTMVVVTLQVIAPRESLYVVLDDPLPAGLEAVNPEYRTESEERQRQMRLMETNQSTVRWWQGFNHTEIQNDRILLYADSLLPGIHTHRYLARALSPGLFTAPGTTVEEMYSPEVFGRSPELKVKITK